MYVLRKCSYHEGNKSRIHLALKQHGSSRKSSFQSLFIPSWYFPTSLESVRDWYKSNILSIGTIFCVLCTQQWSCDVLVWFVIMILFMTVMFCYAIRCSLFAMANLLSSYSVPVIKHPLSVFVEAIVRQILILNNARESNMNKSRREYV